MNNCCLLERASKKYLKTALIYKDKNFSFQELNKLCCFYTKLIESISNEIIVIKAIPCPQYISLIFAIIRCRKIFLPISIKETDNNIKLLCHEINGHFINPLDLNINNYNNIHNYNNYVINITKPTNIILTSGSQGKSKKVVHTLLAHIKSALGAQKVCKITKKDTYLLSLPLNHVGGQSIIFKSVLFGATIVINEKKLEEELQLDRITIISLVPTQLFRIIRDTPKLISTSKNLKKIILGGGPISDEIIKKSLELNPNLLFFMSYGLTEMASQVCTYLISKKNIKGGILPFRKLKINNNEIFVSGDSLALGYYNNNKIDKLTDSSGWFQTKDIGYFKNGVLNICGRKDNLFISGGENIQPETLEKELLQFIFIKNVIVVPIPNDEWGNIISAIIQTEDNSNIEEYLKIIKKNLNHLYIPKIWFNWPTYVEEKLKIQRKEMQQYALDKYIKEDWIINLTTINMK
ncbi:MAG: AMP-binding protein [Succinivibrionaceae bacterium]